MSAADLSPNPRTPSAKWQNGAVLSLGNLPGTHEKKVTYTEVLRTTDLSMGVYSIPAGEFDPQSPHSEDEIYYIREGFGTLHIGQTEHPVTAGHVFYVPAGVPHRFDSIRQTIVALVIFAPAEGSRQPKA